jgi:membrane fusion protein, multidrug efflux system
MKSLKYSFLIYIALPCFAFSCKPSSPGQDRVEQKNIEISRVSTSSYQPTIRASGMLASKDQVNLSFMTGGRIKTIHVGEGKEVKKGQILAELDMTEIGAKVRQAALAHEKAERDFARIKSLHADSVVTLENLQDIETALQLAKANLDVAVFNQQYSTISAPSDGKILKKLAEANELIAPGHPVFAFASTAGEWVLRISLSDRDIVRINYGDSARITFDAYPGQTFRAEVFEMSNASNPLNGTFDAELKLMELPPRLVTGLIGSSVIYPPGTSHPLIPYNSLVKGSGMKAWVYVIVNSVPVKSEVDIHAISDEGVYIGKGLEEGDSIVSAGTAYIE